MRLSFYLLCFLIPFTALAQNDIKEAIAAFNKGVEYSRDSSFTAALEKYNEVLTYNHEVPEVHYYRGNAQLMTGDYQAAVESFDKAIAIDSADAMAWFHRAATLTRLERFDEALASYDSSRTHDNASEKIEYNKGLIYLRTGMYRDAVNSFEAVINVAPQYADAHVYKGLAKLKGQFAMDTVCEDFERGALGGSKLAARFIRLICMKDQSSDEDDEEESTEDEE